MADTSEEKLQTVNISLKKLPGPVIDLGTFIGFFGATGAIVWALLMGGELQNFINYPGMLIVFASTFFIVMASYSIKEVLVSIGLIGLTFFQRGYSDRDVAHRIMQIAAALRGQSFLVLQGGALNQLKSQPLLHRGLSMLVDGFLVKDVVEIIKQQTQAIDDRHVRAISIIQRAAEVAPAMGLMGTVIGLVQMLRNLEDPSSIGPAMAVALLTTFYGSLMANFVLIPLSSKLSKKAMDESLINQLYILGLTSIGAQENPRRTEAVLNSLLPSSRQLRFFD
ncbi:MAG: MotA/TolQ/ExbB proton channel family protein [Alphaproteobacteria bacterium]|nr:MotA/TolQ/ExbB proton channel family protein [Alphaproteobacteria bacterium]